MRMLKITLALSLTTTILISCKKFDEFDKIAKTAWNPNLAVAVGYADFGVYDILAAEDSTDLIVVDPQTGALALSYSNQLSSLSATQLFGLGSVSESFDYTLVDLNVPVSASYSGNANMFRNEVMNLATPNSEEIHTIFFNSGILDVHLETTLRHDMTVTLTFPDFLDQNNNPLTRTSGVTFSGTIPQTLDLQVNLDEINSDFTNNGTTVNQTRVQVQASVMGTGQPVTGLETFSMDFSSNNLMFHELTGYLGQQPVISQIDSVLLKIYKNSTQGNFELVNPTVDFIIDNSFGIPLQLNLNELKTIETNTGTELPILNFPTAIDVAAPAQIGQTATTNFQLNSSNTSNLSSVISPTPKYFYYDIDGLTNPDGPVPPLNFVDENSKCDIKVEVNMPLEGYAYGFFVSDTIDFSFDDFSSSETDMIDYIMFRLIVNNGFPVNLGTQISALDANGNVLFTLFNQPEDIVVGAPVDAAGRVTTAEKKITDITLNEAQIAMMDQIAKLIIYGEASTTDSDTQEIVKFYDDYKINLKLAIQIQASTSF